MFIYIYVAWLLIVTSFKNQVKKVYIFFLKIPKNETLLFQINNITIL